MICDTGDTGHARRQGGNVVVAVAAGVAIGWLLGASWRRRWHAGCWRRQRLRRGTRRLAGRLRYLRGVAQGVCYRVARRHPSRAVDDGVLADRVRSMLGPVERWLDLPRLHVSVDRHVVHLHGEVDSGLVAAVLVGVVRGIPGVAAVESHLHIGLLPSDTRPHQGRVDQRRPSAALRRLLAAATAALAGDGEPGRGGGLAQARLTAHAVVACFAACLPAGARRRLVANLPADVGRLADLPASHHARRLPHGQAARDVAGVTAAVAAWSHLDAATAERAVTAVLAALREQLSPRQAERLRHAVPAGLQALWPAAAATVAPPAAPVAPAAPTRRAWHETRPGVWRWEQPPVEPAPARRR
jgi:uncharacterized protein (DUF2267 family)